MVGVSRTELLSTQDLIMRVFRIWNIVNSKSYFFGKPLYSQMDLLLRKVKNLNDKQLFQPSLFSFLSFIVIFLTLKNINNLLVNNIHKVH